MEKKSSQPDKFYIDLSLTNTGTIPIPAQVVDIRNQNILDYPEEYEMSIVRFECSTNSIPIFMVNIPDPVGHPTRTDYSITLYYGGVYSRAFIEVNAFEAKNGVFSYETWTNYYNVAAAAAFAGLPGGITATKPPYFQFDPATLRLKMYVQTDYLETNANRIQIGINFKTSEKFNFTISTFNSYNDPNGMDLVIAVKDYGILIPPYGSRSGYPYFLSEVGQAAAGDYLMIENQLPNAAAWSFVKAIVFTTNLIPVVRSYLPGTSSNKQGSSVSSTFLPTLTDFALLKSDSNFPVRTNAVYLPTAEYRRLSLNKSSSFNTLDFQAYYQDYNLNLYPIQLLAGTNVSLKVYFERK